MGWNLASALNVASSASRQNCCLHSDIIMQFCPFCDNQSFVSGPLFQFASLQQTYKTARQEVRPSPPRRCRRRPRPRPLGECARPRRLRRPRPASGAAGHGHVPGGSAPVLAAGAGRGRRPFLVFTSILHIFKFHFFLLFSFNFI